MDIGKSFLFMFEDEDWVVKILVGAVFALLSIILIGIPFLLGYMLEVIRRVARQDPEVLPDWDNLGEKFVQGLVLLVIIAIWMLPVWVLACLQTGLTIPLADNPDTEGFIAALSICVACLNILWGIVIALLSPAIYARYAMTEQFSAAFQVGEIWKFTTQNFVNIILAVILSWVAGFVASFGVILCVVGIFVTWFWSQLVQAHLYGQVYLQAQKGPKAPLEEAA